MLATAGGQECYLLLCNRGQMSCVAYQKSPSTSPDQSFMAFNQSKVLAVSRAEKTVLSVVGLFAVQCEAEGHGMVLKLGIKGGERWAGRIQHQLPLLLLLLLGRTVEEVMARSESSSADVTCQSYTITVMCCSSRQG